MSTDPHPELRCRCVARYLAEGTPQEFQVPDPYYDRCEGKAGTDGYCDHCRSHHVEPFALPGGRECMGDCCQSDRFAHADLFAFQMDTPCLLRVDKGSRRGKRL